MRTKPTTVDPVIAFKSRHPQLEDVYYFVLVDRLVTVQVRQIAVSYLRRRLRAMYIDQLAEATAVEIGRSIERVAKGCDPQAHIKHLRVSYRETACGITGSTADALSEIDCPTCLVRMYQTAVANPFVRDGGQS